MIIRSSHQFSNSRRRRLWCSVPSAEVDAAEAADREPAVIGDLGGGSLCGAGKGGLEGHAEVVSPRFV
ncbi:hypothetical protein [Streptacidiphilus pinicola]|uniref:hypothetical protein n=1 Tax=Streptacidiphilus pinicola TaxID=2219663 RepID=UPI0010576B5F|nr:hypothetical protein [Streptacidiphilus pinicola]